MEEGFAAAQHAGRETELTDERVEVARAALAVCTEAGHDAKQVEAALVVDGDGARDRVDDEAQVPEPATRTRALLLVDT